jgi:excisionase family DNA binding protein
MVEAINDRFLKIEEVSNLLQIGERQIYEFIRDGMLIGHKFGHKTIRISEHSLCKYIEETRINPEDYFDPDLNKNETSEPPLVRSAWMVKK